MGVKVYMPRTAGSSFELALRARLDEEVDLVTGSTRPSPADYEILVDGRPAEADLDASPRLRHLVIPYAGLPPATAAALAARPQIAVHNLHHNAAPVAEMVIGLLVAAARRVVACDQALRRHDWRPRYAEHDRGLLLAERTAVVVGYGAIGRRVARALVALDMHVLGVRRTGRGQDGEVALFDPSALDALLERADVLILAVPLTDATRNLIDARRLALMPKHAVLVNVSRGGVIEEQALYDALVEGHLGGAGLDVWWRYPEREATREHTAPSALPFGELDSVVLSPHRAGHAAPTEALRARHLADLLHAAARGDEVPSRVHLDLGY